MTVTPERRVVVVDGSNLATEGRTTPSLRQLDEAVRAYAAEDPGAEIVVVVDASFEHRIDPSEHKQFVDAELHGELVSPPAGAIGRGDAFVLRIAERTGARVLSNDSFQEFHAEHPWLFDGGRLVGGKPVPGVGWIFTPRIPVRGPKSRQATGKAKRREAEELSPPVKAAELAKAAKKVAARKAPAPVLPGGAKPKVGDVWPSAAASGSAAAATAKKAAATAKKAAATAKKAAKKPEEAASGGRGRPKAEKKVKAEQLSTDEGAAQPPKQARAKKAPAKKQAAKKPAAKTAPVKTAPVKTAPAKKAPAKVAPARKEAGKQARAKKKTAPEQALPLKEAPVKKRAAATKKKAASSKEAPAAVAGTAGSDGAAAARGARVRARAEPLRPTAAKNPVVQEAIGQALAEVIAPLHDGGGARRDGRGEHKHGKRDAKGAKQRRRRAQSPPPAVNEPLAFITFVATYPLDSELEGEVVSFTSHGAMVDVDLPGGGVLHSYIPLTAMDDPPPTKARQLLQRGERRRFVLVALDPPRRVAELALPEFVASHRGTRG